MLKRRSQTLIGICFVGLVATGGYVVLSLPGWVARLAYAAESGRAAAAREHLAIANDLSQAFQYVSTSIRPSVVSINSVKRMRVNSQGRRQFRGQLPDELRGFFGDDFGRFFDMQPPGGNFEQKGMGSGVIVSADGYVLTNNHVVSGADDVDVNLSDGRTLKAKIVGADEKTDVAVLKVDAKNLTPAPLGNSDRVEVGQWVLAFGSPFELQSTVTAGIISAKGRSSVGITDYEDFLQTDAAINPGNSGGPLVNMQGEVIGINTAIATRGGGFMGVGFAIPVNMASHIMDSLIKTGRVERAWLGAQIRSLDEDLAKSFGHNSTDGVLVEDVVPKSPAAKAGLQSGDIVLQINGKAVRNAAELRNSVASSKPRSRAELVVLRDGRMTNISAQLEELTPETENEHRRATTEVSSDLGLSVVTLSSEMAKELGLRSGTRGVVVSAVDRNGVAADRGIQPGDIITNVGNTPVQNVAEFREAMQQQDLRTGVRLTLLRDGSRRIVVLKSIENQ